MTDKTPEEQAVIDAAEKYRDAGCGLERVSAMTAIHNAVDALRASRKPKGVKPETVRFGRHFRFVDLTDPELQMMVFKKMQDRQTGALCYVRADGAGRDVHRFTESDRIIPIQEEEGGECEHEREVNTVSGKICPDCDISLP